MLLQFRVERFSLSIERSALSIEHSAVFVLAFCVER
jgi:hypothetical protein